MNAIPFAASLETIGVQATVEEQGRLAVIIPTTNATLDARTRRAIVALARTHGYTNVCVELEPVDAAVSGD